ncbi:MAG: molybdenum cofactor biosynthesis protein MoaE [Candidatus Eremiobacteraeota bacterium]|nr:molybdenum cofactor biosynthesis protein MoaE [Candidatus Eremiobacteraeota bacterium]
MFDLVRTPIDLRMLESAVASDAFGGVVTFVGMVRNRARDGAAVTGLSYEAFVPLAIEEFRRIADEAGSRFGEVRLAIVHRVGDLAVGDIAVAVAAAAPHRQAAFEACEFAIGALKSRAPIWKQEHYADGPDVWVANDC